MIVDIMDSLNKIAIELEKFMDKNYDNPFFWITLFLVLLLVAVMTISKFGDK